MTQPIERHPQRVEPPTLGELRVKLDRMGERIVGKLKARTLFPQNLPVYESGGVEIQSDEPISFLEFATKGLEEYHGTLGRFMYSDQFPLSGALPNMTTPVRREVGETSLQQVEFSIAKDLFPFYTGLIKEFCEEGNDSTALGETVYVDADLLALINERVNMGRYVAERKLTDNPGIYEAAENEEVLLSHLKDVKREEDLIEKIRQVSEGYGLNPDMTEKVFRWMIERTIDVEIAYVQQTAYQKPEVSE